MTTEEAENFHKMGENRADLLRDTAKLVITSRLHVASPCIAMGIPVILTKHDNRFGFIDRFISSYDWKKTDSINWNPEPINIEKEKTIIKQCFFNKVNSLTSQLELEKMWSEKENLDVSEYIPDAIKAINQIDFKKDNFKYAVLGIISEAAYYIVSAINNKYPESELVCGIDSYVKKDFLNCKTISIKDIPKLPSDVIIITVVDAALESAKPFLNDRPYIFIKNTQADCTNM